VTERIKEESSRLPSINGLRGVAVILVLGFHFGVPLFERGYWGVDLFFWISGFLITGGFLREYSLNRELHKKFGWIDIRYYFIKRVRRILPLSILVLGAVTSITYIFGDENALSQTLKRVPRILSFTFNMQLQSDSQDYFLKSFQDYGLLHYWTLSVEEQIYILSPLLFIFAVSFHGLRVFGYETKWYQRVLGLNLFLSITSFYFMLKQNESNSLVNYYSTFSRFWEFGLGSIAATLYYLGVHRRLNKQVRVYLIQVSSLILIFSFILLENQGFGPLVLIPLISTSIFVILSIPVGEKDFLSRVLNLKLLQFFGDIAFPLYLIHWPAMVLLRSAPDQSSLFNIVVYLIGITLLSYLVHKHIEMPILRIDISRFRLSRLESPTKYYQSSARRYKKLTFVTLIVLLTSIGILSYPKAIENSFNNAYSFFNKPRYSIISEKNLPADKDADFETNPITPKASVSLKPEATTAPEEIQSGPNSPLESKPSPTMTAKKAEQRIDSQWLASLEVAVKTPQTKRSYVAAQSVLMEELKKSWFSGCLDSKSAESACVEGNGEKEMVLLGDSFAFALKDAFTKSLPPGWRLRILTKGSCLPWNVTQYKKDGTLRTDCSDHASWVQEYIARSRPEMIVATGADQWLVNSSYDQWLTGFRSAVKFYTSNSKKVVIISSAPGSGNLKDCVGDDLSMQKCFGTPNQISRFVKTQKQESESLEYRFVNLIDYLCLKSVCPAVIDNTPVYADGNHMSANFSRNFSAVIKNLRIYD
jgi:peptidoglycan/LPS O-acetylase OafA/YrhL